MNRQRDDRLRTEQRPPFDKDLELVGVVVVGPHGAMSLSLLKFVGQASLVDDAMLPS